MENIDISRREAELEEIKKKLKNDFIGLDSQIDKIIETIKIWYILPDLIMRPVIVNLWGMTGTGKTDLVRKLSEYLNMSDKLFEVQMDSIIQIGYKDCRTLSSALSYSDIDENERGIILLDEWQRYATIDKMGNDVQHEHFTDVWMLLSDGVFNRNASTKTELEEDIDFFESHIKDEEDELKSDGEDASKAGDSKIGFYYAKKLKKIAKIDLSISDISRMTYKEIIPILRQKMGDKKTFFGKNYSKCLIFVAGNLDDAYSMSGSVADADNNADILHKYSKKITVPKVKNCLKRLFRPEQIARLGSNHVIYPCLSSDDYTKIILKTVQEFSLKIKEKFDIELKLDNSIIEILYRNYVYPSQGVRPVFSGVNTFLSKAIPEVMFHYISNKCSGPISFYFDNNVFANVDGEIIKIDYKFDLDNIKRNISLSKKTNFAVHEAAHAIIYAKRFGYAPKQININITNFDGAYIIPNEMYDTPSYAQGMIDCLLAGTAAEELVFGNDYKSFGCESDIKEATKIAALMLRRYGAYDYSIGHYSSIVSDHGVETVADLSIANDNIIKILQNSKKEVKEELDMNKHLLKKLVNYLLESNEMNGKEFCELFKLEMPSLKYVDPLNQDDDEIVYNYHSKYEEWSDIRM